MSQSLKFPLIHNLVGENMYSRSFRLFKKIADFIYWNIDKNKDISNERLKALHNKYQNKQCFIIGNGPSLNKMDLSHLKNEYTFGLNRIYLLFPKLNFTTTFYVCVNYYVIKQSAKDIEELSIPKFISWHSRHNIDFTNDMMYIRTSNDLENTFSKTPYNKIWDGATVTYATIQLAYFLGFSTVYLIGVDHNFNTTGKPHTLVTSEGKDPNHFDPNYFGKGYKWQLPDLQTSEKAYQIAYQTFKDSNREIFDATIDGKLNIFPKIDYYKIFNN